MTAPAWAKGHPVEELQQIAAVFAEHDRGLILGAFTRVNEATVAGWLTAGHVSLSADGRAAVAWRRVRVKETVKDFAGRAIARPLPGDIVVWRFAGAADQLAEQLQALDLQTLGMMFLNAWQEHPADRALLDRLGAAWQGTKIRASSELVGVYAIGQPAARQSGPDWPALSRLTVPRLDVGPLAARLPELDVLWQDHYSSYNARRSWSALALRGYGGLADFIEKPAEMSKAWKREHPAELAWQVADTPLRAALPEAEPLIAAIPGRKHRVRLMRLQPGGGELTRHADITDPDAGTADRRLMRIHVPVVTNELVRFEGWQPDGSKQQAHMAEGDAWYLDTRKPHTARNDGLSPRVHLVMDVEATPSLRGLLWA